MISAYGIAAWIPTDMPRRKTADSSDSPERNHLTAEQTSQRYRLTVSGNLAVSPDRIESWRIKKNCSPVLQSAHQLVGTMGLEPTRCCHQRILSPLRLPFRHIPIYKKWRYLPELNRRSQSCSLLPYHLAKVPRCFYSNVLNHYIQRKAELQPELFTAPKGLKRRKFRIESPPCSPAIRR